MFRASIASTAESFATLLADIQAIDPPPDLEAPHQEAVQAGERVVDVLNACAGAGINNVTFGSVQ